MFDYHIHSAFSADSHTPPRAVIEQALAGGLRDICFTDHIDHGFLSLYTGTLFTFDPKPYFEELSALREEYRDRIRIKIGLELGVQPHTVGQCNELLSEFPFDYVIASVHNVSHLDLTGQALTEKYTPAELWSHYFSEMFSCLQRIPDFRAVGHLDVPKRYNSAYAECDLAQFEPQLRSLFTYLSENGKGLEVNTGGLLHGLPHANPYPDLLALYRDCGGEILTFGSDSHRAATIGHKFRDTARLLDSLGFRWLCTYEAGEPEYHALKQWI